MRWRSAEVSAGEAGEIVSLAAGEAEGFAACTAAVAGDAGDIAGEGVGGAAGVGDASSQFTKPEVGEELFCFPLGFPKVWS